MTVVFQMCHTIHPSTFRFVFSLQTEVFYIVYWLMLQLSFVTSQNLSLLSFCNTSKKQHFRFFSRFFSEICPKSRSLKLNISRTAWRILTILVSFCRILNGHLDEINLFWRCSSPLKVVTICLIICLDLLETRA